MKTKEGKQAIYAASSEDWRKWLEENGQTEKSVWLILYYKKSTVQCLNLNQATEEALCFGWIDSVCKGRGTESYYRRFTPRKSKQKQLECSQQKKGGKKDRTRKNDSSGATSYRYREARGKME